MTSLRKDLTVAPDLAHQRRTGPVRLERPEYVDLLPPCNQACPAGEDIQGWLALVAAGRLEDAGPSCAKPHARRSRSRLLSPV